MGIETRLISPQYVAPFVKTNKNDRNDAEAIVEAASRPAMRFVTVKTIEQQDMLELHRLRLLLVHQRTAIINHCRGVLARTWHRRRADACRLPSRDARCPCRR